MNKISYKECRERLLTSRINKRLLEDKYTSKENKTRDKNNLYKMQLKKNPTKAEIIVKEYLSKHKMGVQFQKGFFVPFHRIVDFYIPNLKIIIEIDGGYHKETVDKDKKKDSLWSERGITTIRITNEEVFDGSFKSKIDSIPIKKKKWELIKESYQQVHHCTLGRTII